MNSQEMWEMFAEQYELSFPRPRKPLMTKQAKGRIAAFFAAGLLPALFAGLATASEFYQTRIIAGMDFYLAVLSAIVGVMSYELMLLVMPFMKGWLPEEKQKYVDWAIWTALTVSVFANLTFSWMLISKAVADGEGTFLYYLRIGFVLVTGISGGFMAYLLGESAGSLVRESDRENQRRKDNYYAAVEQWEEDRRQAWFQSKEYKALEKNTKSILKGATSASVDWRTLTDEEKQWVSGHSVDDVMARWGMSSDQRKTAVRWVERAQELFG